jgi:hypothetical protein
VGSTNKPTDRSTSLKFTGNEVLRDSGAYVVLAEVVLLLHLFWCTWVMFGWAASRRHRVLRWVHLVSVGYAIFIELTPWPLCPLTVAETWLERRAGWEPAHGPFLLRLLDAVIYPNLPEWVVVGSAVAVCVVILGVYIRRYVRGEI